MSKKKRTPPAGWSTKNLGDILGPVHGAKFAEIWNHHQGNVDLVTRELRDYLTPFEAEFSAKGFSIVWVSYAVPYYVLERLQGEIQKNAALTAADVTDDLMRKHANPWT